MTKKSTAIARYIPLVAAAALAGLAVSLYLSASYVEPLLHVLNGVLK